MDTNTLILVFAVAIILMLLKTVLSKKPMPPSKTFRCAKCSAIENYGPRTIEAWRKGVKKLYCQSCHRAWLNKQPKQLPLVSAKSPSGCIPILLIGFLLSIYFVSSVI
jgi:hypothetical protein